MAQFVFIEVFLFYKEEKQGNLEKICGEDFS